MQIHKDPITGAICAHSDQSVWKLFWLGPGSETIYIGRCMSEVGMVTSAPGVGYVTTGAEFRLKAQAFLEGATI